MITPLFFYMQQNQKAQRNHFKLGKMEGFLAQGVTSGPLLLKARQNAITVLYSQATNQYNPLRTYCVFYGLV